MINKAIPFEAILYSRGNSIPEVACLLEIPPSTLRFRLKRLGLLRSRGDGVRLAEKKGRISHVGNKTTRTKETLRKLSKTQRAIGEATAIGFSYKPNGYMEFTRGPYKGKSVHTVVMEKHIGRKLKQHEVVHHIDGVRSNNHIKNLQLLTRSEHASLHRKRTEIC